MSRNADPRDSASSLFSGALCADPACFLVNDAYAVSTGTSMAAPIVTGAAALLLQREPSLSSAEVRALLQAGTRPPRGGAAETQQVGAGVLDLLGSLRAQDLNQRAALTGQPAPSHSRLVLASSFVRPDPEWPLSGLLLLRNSEDEVVDVEQERILFDAPGAASVVFTRRAPGLYDFGVAARVDSGGYRQRLRVLVDDELLLQQSVPIAVDRSVAHAGFSARGGCSIACTTASGPPLVPLVLLWFLSSSRRRRKVALGEPRQAGASVAAHATCPD
jgi:uncharacterized protein (TIGR03382 family)